MLTILESTMDLAINFPRNRNFEQTSSTTLNLVLGPRGVGNRPTGLWMYLGILDAPNAINEEYDNITLTFTKHYHTVPCGAPGTGQLSPLNNIRSDLCSSREARV